MAGIVLLALVTIFACYYIKKNTRQEDSKKEEKGNKARYIFYSIIFNLLTQIMIWISIPSLNFNNFSTEVEDYDGIYCDEINNQTNEHIYGNINEAIEFQAMENPYYGGEIDDGPTAIKTIQNPYYDGGI